jgi:hypothetical protein
MDNLAATDWTCFDLSLPQPPDWAFYQFAEPAYLAEGQPLSGLTILNASGAYDPALGWYSLSGQVRNDTGQWVQYVQPVGTLYNANQTVLGCSTLMNASIVLSPGQTSPFQITFSGRDEQDVASYRLQVDGELQQ